MFNDLLDKTGKGIIKASEKLEKVLTLPDKGLEKIFGDMTVGELQNLLLDKTGKGIIKASEKLEKVLTLPDKGLEKIFGDMTVGELQQKIKEKVPKLKNFEGVKSQKGGIGTEFASAGGIGALTVGALAIKKFKENPSSLNTFEENTKRLQEQVNFIKSNYTLGTTDDPDSVEAAKQLTQIRNVIEEVKSKEKLSKKQINSFNKILESIEKITGPVKGKA